MIPCWRPGIFGLCLVGAGGALEGSASGLPGVAHTATPFAAVGGRTFADWQLTRLMALTAQLELLAPLVKTTLEVGGQGAWTTPALTAALTLGVRFSGA